MTYRVEVVLPSGEICAQSGYTKEQTLDYVWEMIQLHGDVTIDIEQESD